MQSAARAVSCAARAITRPALKSKPITGLTVAVRSHGTASYRTAPGTPPRKDRIVASLFGGFMWWWIIWHCWTEPDHLTGEFPRPYPESWTDEELGIPPDSEGVGGRTQVY